MRIGALKQSYADDQALFDTPVQRVGLMLGALALVAFPFIANELSLIHISSDEPKAQAALPSRESHYTASAEVENNFAVIACQT